MFVKVLISLLGYYSLPIPFLCVWKPLTSSFKMVNGWDEVMRGLILLRKSSTN